MRPREYEPSDCTALAELFRRIVHRSCSGDYTAEQLDAWAPGMINLCAWGESLEEHGTFVAEEGCEIISFGDIDSSGYLDRSFVCEDRQRRGVASAICEELECAFAGMWSGRYRLGPNRMVGSEILCSLTVIDLHY